MQYEGLLPFQRLAWVNNNTQLSKTSLSASVFFLSHTQTREHTYTQPDLSSSWNKEGGTLIIVMNNHLHLALLMATKSQPLLQSSFLQYSWLKCHRWGCNGQCWCLLLWNTRTFERKIWSNFLSLIQFYFLTLWSWEIFLCFIFFIYKQGL